MTAPKAEHSVVFTLSNPILSVILGVCLNLGVIAFFFGGQSQHIEELERRLTAHEQLQKIVIDEIHGNALKTTEKLSEVLQRTVAIETKIEVVGRLLEKHLDISERRQIK